MKKYLVGIALAAGMVSMGLASPAFAGPLGPHETPTIGAPHTFTTFNIGALKDVDGWELSLWSNGVLVGRVFSSDPAGIVEEIGVVTEPTPSCTYQADIKVETSPGVFHFYSGTRLAFPIADCT
jgi:hypothetical protein